MKKNNRALIFIAYLIASFNSQAQLVVKNFSIADSKIGGECKLLKSSVDINGDIASKTFEIEVLESGNFYLNVLQNYCGSKKIKVKVDDSVIGDVESTKKDGLDVFNISDASHNGGLIFTKGKHLIKFELEDKLIPQIDYISLSKEADKSNFDLSTIKNEQKELKSKDLKNYNKEDAKNAWLSLGECSPQKTVSIATGFPKSYDYAIDVNYKYTYFSSFYFTTSQQVVLETYNSNCDPVMELVSADGQYSWVNDDYSQYESRIEVTIPASGFYYMRVRPYWSNSNGISNIMYNSNVYATNVAIQWTYVNVVNQPADGIERNYFTAKHNDENLYSYDTYMWIEDGTTLPGKILARNDDYTGGGDFNWRFTSRIKKSFSSMIRTVWVNAYSQYSESTCDVYVKAPNSTINNQYYENLNPNDAILSGPEDDNYNCISWSGGIYEWYEWPLDPYSTFYDTYNNDPMTCFNNYYGNNVGLEIVERYVGATTYYRTDNDNSDVAIDLYGYGEGDFSHATVRNFANNQPHGYSWESKRGEGVRMFHPREALQGNYYGNVMYHYAPASTQRFDVKLSTETLAKSVNLGLSAVDNERFSDSEKQSLKKNKEKIDKLTIGTFDEMYGRWKQTWKNPEIAIYSDPNKFTESKEYKQIFDYCKSKGKELCILVIEKLNNGDIHAKELLKGLTMKDNYNLMLSVHSDNKKKPVNADGALLVRSPYVNSIKYAKKLLVQEKIIQPIETLTDPIAITVASKVSTNQLQINISVEDKMTVKIEIYDLNGKLCKLLASKYQCNKGLNTYSTTTSELTNGIYICKVTGEVEKIAKFILRR